MNEAMGKILGMAMAYGVSSLGLFLAYANYRRRTLGAQKVMTGKAWTVLAVVILTVVGGAVVVGQLMDTPPTTSAEVEPLEEPSPPPPAIPNAELSPPPETERGPAERERWPLVGILIPAFIFFIATWVTSSLHRHFVSQVREETPGRSV